MNRDYKLLISDGPLMKSVGYPAKAGYWIFWLDIGYGKSLISCPSLILTKIVELKLLFTIFVCQVHSLTFIPIYTDND